MSSEPEKPESPEPESAPEPAARLNPVKEMFVLAALYLPLGFFLWFFFASALMAFPARLSEWVLTGFFPEVFEQVVQLGFQLEIQTGIELARRVEGRVALLDLQVNPMIYAWGMALLFGLIMATPLSAGRRLAQLALSYLVMSVVTVWGVFWEAWRDLAFLMGPEAEAVVAESAFNPTMIALFYQLGYLMLPAVIPVAAWILMNRPFVETIARLRRS